MSLARLFLLPLILLTLIFQRGIVRVDSGGDLRASTTGSQASSRLASLVGANALIVVPPGAEPLPEGSRVEAILVGALVPERDE